MRKRFFFTNERELVQKEGDKLITRLRQQKILLYSLAWVKDDEMNQNAKLMEREMTNETETL